MVVLHALSSAYPLLRDHVPERGEDVHQTARLRVALRTVAHDCDRVCDAGVRRIHPVKTSELVGEDYQRSSKEKIYDSGVSS